LPFTDCDNFSFTGAVAVPMVALPYAVSKTSLTVQ
jgi:hypothetical protein